MKKSRNRLLLWVGAFLFVPCVFVSALEDPNLSQEENSPRIITFIESPNCPWSEKLLKEVLEDSVFLETIQGKIIMEAIQIFEGASLGDPEPMWVERYQVHEFPTVILVDEMGEEIFRSGFLPLTGKAYADYLVRQAEQYRSFQRKWESAKGKDLSGKQLEELYKEAREYGFKKYRDEIFLFGKKALKSTFFLLEEYESCLASHKRKDPMVLELKKKLISMDPKNEQGTWLRIAMVDFQQNVKRMKKNEEPKEVVEPLIEYIDKFGEKDTENAWRLDMMVSQFLFSQNKLSAAIKYAKKSLQAAPEVVRSDVAQTVAYLEKCRSQK